jgi:cytoskeletal protein RodZ
MSPDSEKNNETSHLINNALETISSVISEEAHHEPEEISIGKILRDKRRSLKMEISDVTSHLRVKTQDIEAIENDDLASVTKHLYVPGLIHSYSRFLKVDQKLIEEKIKFLPIKSNVENKKHQLLNIGEGDNLTPNRDFLLNFFLITLLLFLVLLSLYYSYESKQNLITNQSLIEALDKIGS